MTSSNCYSSLYPFPIDLNEDDQHQKHQLFSLNPPPSSSSSLTCPNLFFNPAVHEHQAGYYQSRVQNQHFPPQEDQAKVYVPLGKPLESDSHVLKLSIWKKEEEEDEEERNGSHQNENSSAKWMSSKMRMMRKTMSSDHADNLSNSSGPKFEDQKQQLISLSPDNSCSNSSYNVNNSCNTIRVCADCNTTKTPLWRSGPRGPKSLCNACGIRQRKARRAMAAAAAAAAAASVNGSAVAAEKTPSGNKSKVQQKAKRSSNNGCHQQLKNQIKKSKLISSQSHHDQYQGRKKLCFEELRIILSKNSAFHRVFPQDEKDAAILLMALSYGLVHG